MIYNLVVGTTNGVVDGGDVLALNIEDEPRIYPRVRTNKAEGEGVRLAQLKFLLCLLLAYVEVCVVSLAECHGIFLIGNGTCDAITYDFVAVLDGYAE